MIAAIVTACLVVLLGACAPTPAPSPTPTATSTSAPKPPTLVPDGTAEDNLSLFDAVTQQVWASEQRTAGRVYIDALIAVGFDREAMQLTEDQTTVGNLAESLQFSVRWGDRECLMGQVGPSTGGAVTTVMPQLAEGRCLIGTTRPIDW